MQLAPTLPMEEQLAGDWLCLLFDWMAAIGFLIFLTLITYLVVDYFKDKKFKRSKLIWLALFFLFISIFFKYILLILSMYLSERVNYLIYFC